MAHEQDQMDAAADMAVPQATVAPARRRFGPVLLVLVGAVICALGAAWLMRKDIADNVVAGQLDKLGLPARYNIVSIGPSEQVVRDLVIGDPDRPDLTIAELRVATRLGWGLPGIGRITLVRPRLYGSVRAGKPSFGSLDKVLFTGSKEPFTMPDLDVKIEDGGALIVSDAGPIGLSFKGEGGLRGGFAGELAALAPKLVLGGCEAGRTSVYGKLTVADNKPRFVGPVRLVEMACPEQGASLSRTEAQLELNLDPALDGGQARLGVKSAGLRYGESKLDGLGGTVRLAYRKQALNARYDLAAQDVITPQARLAGLGFTGRARSAEGLERIDIEGDLSGKGVALGQGVDSALARAVASSEGTLAAPLLKRVRAALAREERGSTLDANVIVRHGPDETSVVVPRGSLRGGSGAALLSLSRVQALFGAGAPRITGNFASGGRDLPRLSGRMESRGANLALNVEMPEYRAGDSRLAVPALTVRQQGDGSLVFAGQARMSGALPGGMTRDLLLPVDGTWSAKGELALWPRCTTVAFDHLQLANFTLERQQLRLCPAPGGAIVRSGTQGLRVAAGAPSLKLVGHLGETPIRIESGAIGFAMPGALTANAVKVLLGPADAPSRFAISHLDAHIGKDVQGTFDDADVGLFTVPLDLRHAAGKWRFADGVLTLDHARFTLVDREQVARFQPMVSHDATLRLADNVITARALMQEPGSGREVVVADIVHDLATATGHADLAVPGIVFDEALQADALSHLALGVVSNLKGQVQGNGRIDWTEAGVTSRGAFSSDGLDFAAAFGPVEGVSGTVRFTDLLGMVTAPDQTLKIARMNPGIEVDDGTLSFEMRPNNLLVVNGAQWPFMQGKLMLEKAHMTIGTAETRYYTLKVEGLDAASFVRHLELSNIYATGVFDGELPLIFDENGGRVENGYLASRTPGGNVSYVGELTYEDLSAMGNFAFDALKSVNYRRMEIGLGGSLSGEIVTRISFDGLSQGTGASKNFLTKQVAKLPIRFILNVKAPFFSLFGSMRSLYDPTFVADPRTLGLVDKNGNIRPGQAGIAPPFVSIQPPVSEKTP